jgi:hypothetical protein
VTLFIGAIIMLFSHDRLAGAMELLALVPMLGAMLWFSQHSSGLVTVLHRLLTSFYHLCFERQRTDAIQCGVFGFVRFT